MNDLLIQPMQWDFDNYFSYASENNFNFELLGFCEPGILDDEKKINELIDIYMPLKDRIYSMHGAFFSLQVTALDSTIRDASRRRIIQNCEICKKLDIKNLILHCDKLPYIREQSYTNKWVDASYPFYSSLIEQYDINIIMENCWDLGPYPLKQLVDKMKTEKFKACIDTGHVHCFSEASIGEWIDVLGNDLIYLHFNDNHGETDEHLPAGSGSFDFQALTDKIAEHRLSAKVVFETFSIDNIKSSIKYLKQNMFYPFNV